ncbi:tail lysozyme [Sulfitobacter phage vB_SupP_AX]|nr:tail lysozyme [Sulfitobacter phage vB_SupP_AX]
MADARLQWRQLSQAQPNVAPLLRQANEGFNNAADAAGSILERYQSGREAAGDREAARRLAGINDEAELDAFLAGGGLSDLNISREMQANLMNTRGSVLGFENDRSIVRDRDGRLVTHQANTDSIIADRAGRLGIAQDVNRRAGDIHGVQMADHAWRQGRRAELAGLSDEVVAGRTEGQQYGSNGVPQGSVQEQVYAGLLQRGMPEHIAQGFMMNFQDESGFNIDITEAEPNVHGTRGKGLYQLTGARRDAFEARYGNNYSIDNQLDFLMDELGGSESRAWEVISQSRNAGEAGANIVNNFLRPASEHARERTARYVGQGGFDVAAASADVQRGFPARDALREAVASSQYLSLEDVGAILNGQDASEAQGDETIAADLAQQQRDLTAQLVMEAVANPENLTTEAAVSEVGRRAEESGTMSSSEVLEARKAAEALIAGSDAMQTELSPTVQQDVAATNIIAGAQSDMQQALQGSAQGRIQVDTQRFAQADDPIVELESMLNLDGDGQSAGWWGGLLSKGEAGYDRNNLRNLVDQIASDNRITTAQAAAVAREIFQRDPTSFLGFNANTLENRFEIADAAEMARQVLNPENVSRFGDANRRAAEIQQDLQTINDQILQDQQRLAKTRDPDERAALEERIAAGITQMTTLRQQAGAVFSSGSLLGQSQQQ